MKVADYVIGYSLEDEKAVLKSMCRCKDGYALVLSDSSGEVHALLPEECYSPDLQALVGGAIIFNGAVLNGKNGTHYVKVKMIEPAGAGTFNPSDLFDGLTQEKVAEFKADILLLIAKTPGATNRMLLNAMLSEDVLDRLATYPATTSKHAMYRGGALVATCVVARIAMQMGAAYQCHTGLYQTELDWGLTMTGALLHSVAVLEYLEPEAPWHRTDVGVDRGYFSLLQSRIEKAIREQNIPFEEERLARLLNMLAASVQMRTEMKASSKEGVLLRYALSTYKELDILTAETAEEKDGSYYNKKMRRFIGKRLKAEDEKKEGAA